MLEAINRFAVEQRWLVLLAALGMAALGVFNYQRLPLDAVPDITNVQVQINTQAPGYSPLEIEQRVTYPLEVVMSGLPGLKETRSTSRYGISQVTVIFEDDTDSYFARQLISQRLQQAAGDLPSGVTPIMGPIATGLGEIYLWTVEAESNAKKPDGSPYTLTDLREIQDWIIKPQLRYVPGVTDVNTIGGYLKQYLVAADPERLAAYGLGLQDVIAALANNNNIVGAGYIEKYGGQYLVRVPGQVHSPAQIRDILIANIEGVPIRLGDVGAVTIGHELRTGAATENGREVVLGTAFMLIGENSRTVAKAVDAKITAINRTLPAGVKIHTVYDRTVLVDNAIATVKQNLTEGAALVIAILFLFLGNIRAALITALVIPLVMLFTFTGMVAYRVDANLMSLGALDFGILIDGAVVIVENCVRRLSAAQVHHGRALSRGERLHEVLLASQEARRPLLFGQAIIMIVYLPVFTLTGVEGKMFQPMAFTVIMALAAAMLLTVTFVPAAAALFIGNRFAERDSVAMRTIKHGYAQVLDTLMANKPVALVVAALAVVLSGLLATRLGGEFVPSLNEGDFAMQALRVPGTSLSQSVSMQQQIEVALKQQFPEVERVFTRIGSAEIATDLMPPNNSDGYIMLKPRGQWPDPDKPSARLRAEMERALEHIPGNVYEFSQPIELRFNELISGVRSDVAVWLYGDDMTVLNATANRVASALQIVNGAAEVKVEQVSGLPMLTVDIDRDKAARYGLSVGSVQDAVATAFGGTPVNKLYHGDRRFDIVVRLPESERNNPDSLARLPIALPVSAGAAQQAVYHAIPLSELANVETTLGPSQISRQNGKRRIVVSCNVRGRDLGSFVAEAQRAVQQRVKIPAGYWTAWGGQFEQLQSAMQRLWIVVPVALLLVFTLLFMMFGNLKDGLLVFSGIPFALTGGVLALWLRGIPLSVSAAVGFIALSGVAVLNGLVMIAFIRNLCEQGMALRQAIYQGALTRLRPVLMTALVASFGFVPMAIATGTGAEVQRPLATVVIGGILSSTLLTLLILPVLYQLVYGRNESSNAKN